MFPMLPPVDRSPVGAVGTTVTVVPFAVPGSNNTACPLAFVIAVAIVTAPELAVTGILASPGSLPFCTPSLAVPPPLPVSANTVTVIANNGVMRMLPGLPAVAPGFVALSDAG